VKDARPHHVCCSRSGVVDRSLRRPWLPRLSWFSWRVRWASFLAAVCIAAGVAAGATAATPLPLRERLMRTRELGGLVVPGRPRLVTNIAEWTTGDPTGEWTTRDPKSLALAGFVRGLREGYGPKAYNGMSALSSVAEFRTAAGARDEVASEVGSVHPPPPTYVAFPVASIPGAHGFKKEGPGITVYVVMFNDGRFQYEIGFGGSPWAIHRHGPAIKAQMIAAARALYRRVHGR
jgi:hypothetical protein